MKCVITMKIAILNLASFFRLLVIHTNDTFVSNIYFVHLRNNLYHYYIHLNYTKNHVNLVHVDFTFSM